MFDEMASYNAWCMNQYLPPGVTTPIPAPTTPKTQSHCCNKLKLNLQGTLSFLEGNYDFEGLVNGREYWTNGIRGIWFYGFQGFWVIGSISNLGTNSGSVSGSSTASCLLNVPDNVWSSNNIITWECLGILNSNIMH